MSRQIISLENTLKSRLFHRKHEGLVLTQEGQVLFEDVSHLLKIYNETMRRHRGKTMEIQGELVIGLPPTILFEEVGEAFWELLKQHPDLTLTFSRENVNMEQGNCHAYICSNFKNKKGFESIRLGSRHYRLCASRKYVECQVPKIIPHNYRHIRIGIPLAESKDIYVDSMEQLISCVKTGLGVGYLLEKYATKDDDIVVFNNTVTENWYYVFHEGDKNLKKIEACGEKLATYFRHHREQ